jgi:excinuclease ABC subunit C
MSAIKNASLSLSRIRQEKEKKPLLDILRLTQDVLELSEKPALIWGIDISHLQGTHIVGSCVCFAHAKPFKQYYRRFEIKSVRDTSDDPKSIAEVLSRRLYLAKRQEEALPHLILIDGGKGQLNAAFKVLQDQGYEGIDIISLAKREELVFKPNTKLPFRLGLDHPVLHLLQQVRDESHRFALQYQRTKRRKNLLNDTPRRAIRLS